MTIVGALTALAGTAVLGASPALVDSDVVAFAHGGIHPTPALAGRVIGAVDPGHGCYLRMLTARAMTRARVTSETRDCPSMVSLAHRDSGMTSVGLKAVALVKER